MSVSINDGILNNKSDQNSTYFIVSDITRAKDLKGIKRGNLCIVDRFGGGEVYYYDGYNFIPLKAPVSDNIITNKAYMNIECECCGSHSFKRVDSGSIRCEYCGNTKYLV